MKPHQSILSALCFILAVASASGQAPEPITGASKPNVLVLLMDDLGYNELGCFGHAELRTPNADRLAQEGIRLTSFYCSAPSCSPSRAGLLTGRIPARYGIDQPIGEGTSKVFLSNREITLATLLKQANYATGHFGKWHLNGSLSDAKQPQPNDHGFDF